MDNKQLKSTRRKEESRKTDNSNSKSILIGSLIATFIAVSPYFFYLYESVPDTQVWDTFMFSYDSKSWGDANYALWVLTNKLLPLLFLIIWFFTCRHWWYHAILVPMAMYIYQVFGFFNENITYVDEFQLMHLVPVMAIIIPSIYLIRARIFDKLNTINKSLQELEDELTFKPKGVWDKVKQYF